MGSMMRGLRRRLGLTGRKRPGNPGRGAYVPFGAAWRLREAHISGDVIPLRRLGAPGELGPGPYMLFSPPSSPPPTGSVPELERSAEGPQGTVGRARKWWERLKWLRRVVEWIRTRPELPGSGPRV